MWKKIFIFSFLVFASCGKNEAIRTAGTSSPGTNSPAPAPTTSPNPVPPGYQQPSPGYPQLPPGMPPQYMPFLPIDNFYRQQPVVIQNYYINVIQPSWYQFAANYGCSPYDFNVFWFEFSPYVMEPSLYNYFDYYYSWSTPYTNFCDYGCGNDYWYYYY